MGVIADIFERQHPAPGLTEQVDFFKVQRFPQRDELLHPGLPCPKLWVSVQVGVPAADLVIHDELPLIFFGEEVQHLEIIMRRSRSAVQQHQRCLFRVLFTDDPVICLMPHKGNITFCDLHRFFLHLSRVNS